ncbi:MAG: hypothetical protein FWC39_11860 [Bacteroidetes bacterium]|nr:hypothetical protein [Bacteroidota bacterium]
MATVDMNYRFSWDAEPTDEQLYAIMQEVGNEVCREKKELQKTVLENIKQATEQAHERNTQTTFQVSEADKLIAKLTANFMETAKVEFSKIQEGKKRERVVIGYNKTKPTTIGKPSVRVVKEKKTKEMQLV